MATLRKRAFGMKGGQCVIMMSLGGYSETDRRRLLYCAAPKGHHYQVEVSGGPERRSDTHTGSGAVRANTLTHAHTHKRRNK